MSLLAILAYKEIIDLKKSYPDIPDFVKALGLICMLYMILGNYGSYSLEYSLTFSRLLLPFVLLLEYLL